MFNNDIKSNINRIHWLDSMKIMGIILIVSGHYTPPYFEYLYTFSVQMFFMMSGFLTKTGNGSLKTRIGKITTQLIIPLLILGFLYNILFAISQIIFGEMTISMFLHNLTGIFTGNVFALGGLWFVYTLIVVKLVDMFTHQNIKPLIAMICIFSSTYFNNTSHMFYNCYANAMLAYPCFYIGELFGKYRERIDRLSDTRILMLLIVAGFWGTIISYLLNGTVWMYAGGYGGNMTLFLLGSIAGTMMCFGLCKLLFNKTNKYALLVADGTILILALHGLVIRLTHQIEVGWWFYIEAIVMVTAFIPIINLCKNYCPVLLGYRGVKNKL